MPKIKFYVGVVEALATKEAFDETYAQLKEKAKHTIADLGA